MTDEPAVGIRVGAAGIDDSIRGGAHGVNGLLGGREAIADDEGYYEISRLSPGAYNVALNTEGELARLWTAQAREAVAVTTGENVQGVDLELIKGAAVTGRIVAKSTGAPLPDVGRMDVGIYGPAHPLSGGPVQLAEIAPDGSYFLRVPRGEQYLYLRGTPPPGFALPQKTTYKFRIKDGETAVFDFELPAHQ